MSGALDPTFSTVSACLNQRGTVHLIGIGGIGMAGLASLLKQRGLTVSGCDVADSSLLDWLRAQGIRVSVGHDPRHLEGQDWAIRTAAVLPDAPESAAAHALGIPLFRRGEVLAALTAETPSAVVAGTHGKTSTASFLLQLLHYTGRAPAFCIGGRVPPFDGPAGGGAPGAPFVVEGDESDGTLSLYAPMFAIVTNMDFDHMEHFESQAAFDACFRTFMERIRGRLFYCADDARTAGLARSIPHAVGYGFSPDAIVQADKAEWSSESLRFVVRHRHRPLGLIEAPLPGRHNVSNLLGAIGVALEWGVPFDEIQRAAARLALPRRRFERIPTRPDLLVISDYGHHPTEIRAVLETAQRLQGWRLRGVFQPHRYTRTRALGPEFPPAFDGLEDLILAPVYEASETPLEGGTSANLYAHFRTAGWRPRLVRSLDEAWQDIQRHTESGDGWLIIGAGSVERIAQTAGKAWPVHDRRPLGRHGLQEALAALPLTASRITAPAPLGVLTTFGVGGEADVLAEVGSESDLTLLLKEVQKLAVPLLILGGGSNLLIPDSGFPGVAIRLSPKTFGSLRREGDRIWAGAAVSCARLLSFAEQEGLGGLEFLEGIPGRVGGLIRMNAGAFGQSIGDWTASVVWMDPAGMRHHLKSPTLRFVYRECPSVASGGVVLEAEFVLTPRPSAEIHAERKARAERRTWMRGLRCAGSVFKNPPGGPPAGRLLEEAELKGRRVGGAWVTTAHANVIAVEGDAVASDVVALMEIARLAVVLRFGISLEPEVIIP